MEDIGFKKGSKRNEIINSKGKYMGYKLTKPLPEVWDAMKDLTSNAYKLLDYYYAVNSGWEFTDSDMANALGVSGRTIGALRSELVEKGYLYVAKGKEVDVYYVGKEAVNKLKEPIKLMRSEIHE